jgi:hypothetical protein
VVNSHSFQGTFLTLTQHYNKVKICHCSLADLTAIILLGCGSKICLKPRLLAAYFKRFYYTYSLKSRPNSGDSHNGQEDQDEQKIQLSEATTSALKTLAQQHQLTLNTLVQGAFALLLSRYSGEEDILFGATSSGRPADLAGVENMVGCFY